MTDTPRQWFVAPDVSLGDGSRAKPFHDPWLALRSSGRGDTIHIAAGTYVGRYQRSSWLIDTPNLTILGGYHRDFSARTPWQTPSVLAAWPGYEYVREDFLVAGAGNHEGLVLDGLFVDGAGRNSYGETPTEGLREYPNMDGGLATFNAKNVTIRNCVFANSATGGVELSGDGSRFENNVLINLMGIGMLDLKSGTSDRSSLVTVTGNSFCFAFDTAGPPFGKGADNAIGVRINRPAKLENNVFVSCGNAGLSIFGDLGLVSIDGNLFYLTPHDVAIARAAGSALEITESSIDEMEDLGLKSAGGNVAQDPGLTGLTSEWIDATSRHLLGLYAKPPRDAVNALRQKAGLPALTPPDVDKPATQGALAPRLSPDVALAIRLASKQGAHPVDIAVSIPDVALETAPTYRPIEWTAMAQPDPSLTGQRVELRAGLGSEQNTTLLDGMTPETHMGICVYEPGTDDGSLYVLARRSTLANRQYDEALKANNAREVENVYLLRGIYHADILPSSRQKATLVLESMTLAPVTAKSFGPRPVGRDWFVKAGSSGGDGTREKPFRDPFQALEKVEGGDAIHVAGGDYFGKLRTGQWKILIRHLTLLGGYNSDFTERDPWKNPTRFLLNEEEKAKGTRKGLILESEETSEGLILDGFIFDGSTYNSYKPNGTLDLDVSPTDSMVALRGAQAPIEVRNCLFINSAAEAISISCGYGVFENNLLLNSSRWALKVNASGAGPWTIRHNTFLFATDPSDRAGTGKSAPDGSLLVLSGRAAVQVEANIFAFGDNYGVRAAMPQVMIALDGNVFAGNLFNHLTDEQYLWVDRSNWERRAVLDSAFASVKDNTLDLPKLSVDPAFADIALRRLFTLPSRIRTDEWKTLASALGSSATPPAPAAAAPVAEAPKPAAAPSLADLIAGLNKPKAPATPTPVADAPAEVVYCPLMDWKKALALAPEGDGPGAHRVVLSVSFSDAPIHADIQYAAVRPQDIAGDLTAWDNKPIELELTDARESSTNPSLYPPGMTKDDYCAYYASTVDESVRTRVSIIVKLDTTVSKALFRVTPTEKLRIRGTARILRNPGALAILADTIEAAQNAV